MSFTIHGSEESLTVVVFRTGIGFHDVKFFGFLLFFEYRADVPPCMYLYVFYVSDKGSRPACDVGISSYFLKS